MRPADKPHRPPADERLIAQIKAMRQRGMMQGEIAAEVGLSQGTVSYLLRRNGLGGRLVRRRSVAG